MAIHLTNAANVANASECLTISGICTSNTTKLNSSVSSDANITWIDASGTSYVTYPYSSGSGAVINSPSFTYKITNFPIDFDSLDDDAELEVIIKGVNLKIAKKKFLEFFKKFFSEELIVGLLLRD